MLRISDAGEGRRLASVPSSVPPSPLPQVSGAGLVSCDFGSVPAGELRAFLRAREEIPKNLSAARAFRLLSLTVAWTS